MARAGTLLAALAIASSTLACPASVKDTSAGEVLVVADTDMIVPDEIARLRIDLYDDAGVWYASHDASRARASDWPASFGIFAEDGESEKRVLVRLRAYGEGKVRDYRGERFEARPRGGPPLETTPSPPPTGQPRLLDGANDVTPASEPDPLLAIDRLVEVTVRPGARVAAHVVLRASCIGTMADVAHRAACVDVEETRVAPEVPALEPTTDAPLPSLAAVAPSSKPCTVAPRAATPGLFDDEVCVPGERFLFGSLDSTVSDFEDLPERFAVVPPFLLDRWEVTVGRWRAAVAAGFTSPDATPLANEADIPTLPTPYTDTTLCTWSATPRGRESYALACVSEASARAFCRFAGGDLPSEVEWEYAAAIAGRAQRTRFPWGGDDAVAPTCAIAVWGRGELGFGELCRDAQLGFGPLPVDARSATDVTPLGIVGLGGGVAERTRDSLVPMTANCWAGAGLVAPGCDVGSAPFSIRGGSWHDNGLTLRSSIRRSEHDYQTGSDNTSDIGFRCMRRGAP